MSDTPETDAMRKLTWKSSQPPVNPIPGEFAKKLERERDQAREALREAIQFRDTTLNGYDLDAWLKAAGLKP
jgi:hypothetical protein